MIKIDLHANEFLCLYDLLTLQQLQSGDQILLGLRGRMKDLLFNLLKQKSAFQLEKWEQQQLEKLASKID